MVSKETMPLEVLFLAQNHTMEMDRMGMEISNKRQQLANQDCHRKTLSDNNNNEKVYET